MELTQNLGDRNRLTRAFLCVGLAAFALLSLWKGERLRGGLAGLGALALGYTTIEFGNATESLAVDSEKQRTTGSRQLRCAICGDPIVPGQRRQSDQSNEIAHESCLEAPA